MCNGLGAVPCRNLVAIHTMLTTDYSLPKGFACRSKGRISLHATTDGQCVSTRSSSVAQAISLTHPGDLAEGGASAARAALAPPPPAAARR